MKTIILLLFFLTFGLNACGDNTLHVDLGQEFMNRPTIQLFTENGEEIAGFEGSYCTDVVCNNFPDPDYSSLVYTSITPGESFTLKVEENYEVQSVSASLHNPEGAVFRRNIEATALGNNNFLFKAIINMDDPQVTLEVLIDFTVEGRSHYFFPLNFQVH